MEIGFLGILFGYLIPMSKYVIGVSILILFFGILKYSNLNKLNKYLILFISFYLITSFNVIEREMIPKDISTTGIVVDDYVKNENKYVVKIANRKNVLLYSKNNLAIGDVVEFSGKVSNPIGKMNSTDFDYKTYLLSKNIKFIVFSKNEEIVGKNKLFGLREEFKNHVKNSFTNLSKEHGEFLTSVILSDSDYIDEQELTTYRNLGIIHLIAMSGFHIGIVLACLENIFKILKIPKLIRRFLAIGLTYTYIWLVGAPVAAVRAFIMASCQLVAFVLYKKYSPLKSLEMSGLLILLLNPYNIFSISFWMSYTAVLGILISYKRYSYLYKKNFFTRAFGVSMSVFIAISPVMAYFFYEINPISIVSNVILVPIYSIAIILGFIATFTPFGFIVKPSIEVLLRITDFIPKVLNVNCKINIPKPSLVYILILYLAIFFIVRDIKFKEYRFNKFVFVTIVCCTSLLAVNSIIDNSKLQINAIYVGQGDSTHISYRGENYLVDTGGGVSNFRPGKVYLLNYLKAKGIRKIDKLFISHFDEDHVDGVYDLIGNIEIKEAYVPYIADNDYVRTLNTHSNLRQFTKGNKLSENGINFYSLNNYLEHREENDNSMIMLVQLEWFRALFTGDASMIDGIGNEIDFLKVAHHGSRNSTSAKFLKSCNPKFATISAGIDNSYGHPHEEVTSMLKLLETNYKVTSQVGEINFKLGNKIKFSGYLEKRDYRVNIIALFMDLIVLILLVKINERELKENYGLSRTL
ncbi:competence protein ComEC [Peptoniphilus asaccharolyticus DSM 20463]|uniref:Competence protein ComEC n=1 Tax=Peptoniphilus asaccharolyticus DSM 20463 TaxID=573058 RepID=A0A1W1UUP5_PEPAS|nr:DNA internalization-related competence protein ComEC/Rec2 [Peptoniphilus asaccharolyticus]MBL7575207.1 DNA internalization-related competence protein ComEC/Rec2 [Peptoniphilus asaccharolyticus]SMB84817.1 competence protein ComEC [Peptoniphilus asaccharolyticus DSM 20463]